MDLAPGDVPSGPIVRGGLTFRYVGQQQYIPDSLTSDFVDLRVEFPTGEEETRADQFAGTVRVDRLGRRWEVQEVDWDLVDQRLLAAEVEELAAGLPVEDLGAIVETTDDDLETTVWEPMGWSSQTCQTSPTQKQRVWNSESRNQIQTNTMLTGRASSIVIINHRDGNYQNAGMSACSGVMLGRSWVLTAAHCVADGSGNAEPVGLVNIAPGGGAFAGGSSSNGIYDNFQEWHEVEAIYLDGAYNGNNLTKDFALLELASPVNSTVGEMRISSASNSSWQASVPGNIAYPGFGPNCSTVQSGSTYSPTGSGYFENRRTGIMFWQADAVNFVSNKKMGTSLDSVGGMSGSPIHRCGGGTCSPAETGWVMAIHTAWFWQNGARHTGGPNANQFRSWALALVDD